MDALNYTIGAVLSQEQGGKWHLVSFHSRLMSPAEQNYEIYNKELLAIINTVRSPHGVATELEHILFQDNNHFLI